MLKAPVYFRKHKMKLQKKMPVNAPYNASRCAICTAPVEDSEWNSHESQVTARGLQLMVRGALKRYSKSKKTENEMCCLSSKSQQDGKLHSTNAEFGCVASAAEEEARESKQKTSSDRRPLTGDTDGHVIFQLTARGV